MNFDLLICIVFFRFLFRIKSEYIEAKVSIFDLSINYVRPSKAEGSWDKILEID